MIIYDEAKLEQHHDFCNTVSVKLSPALARRLYVYMANTKWSNHRSALMRAIIKNHLDEKGVPEYEVVETWK